MARIAILALLVCCQLSLADVDEISRQEQLRREDLRSVQQYFLARNDKLSRFWIGDKRPIDGAYSAMVVTAVNETGPAPYDPYLGVFVVYGKTNQVYMVLDMSAEGQRCCGPRLAPPTKNNVYVHWYGDYGFYSMSHKYEFDLLTRRRGVRHAYKQFSVQYARKQEDLLIFSGESLSLLRTGEGADATWSIGSVSDPAGANSDIAGSLISTTNGRRLEVSGKAISVVDRRGRKRSYPMPMAPSEGRPSGSIENEIGPFEFDGERLWFANTFYDGEGMSGVGAIGSFDVTTLQYEMRYLPEIARWSASALRVNRDDIWIGLMRRPEGRNYGGGVLRFNIKTGATRTYPINDYVVSIEQSGDSLYFGTSHSVYEIDARTDAMSHIRVEPGRTATPEVVIQRLPLL